MTPAERAKLREIASKATPGEWHIDEDGEIVDAKNQRVSGLCNAAGDRDASKEDATHIAAFNPATVLRLLDDLDAALAENERLRGIETAANVFRDTEELIEQDGDYALMSYSFSALKQFIAALEKDKP